VGKHPFRERADMLMVILCEAMIFLSLASALTLGICNDKELSTSSTADESTVSVVTVFLFMINLMPVVLILPLAFVQLWIKLELQNTKMVQAARRMSEAAAVVAISQTKASWSKVRAASMMVSLRSSASSKESAEESAAEESAAEESAAEEAPESTPPAVDAEDSTAAASKVAPESDEASLSAMKI